MIKRSLTIVFLILVFVSIFLVNSKIVAAEREFKIYFTEGCESLFDVSLKFYGNGQYFPAIYKHNYETMWDPDLVYTGQKLKIPVYLTEAEKKDAMAKAMSHNFPVGPKCHCIVNYSCEELANGPEVEWLKSWGLPLPVFEANTSMYRTEYNDPLWKIAEKIYGDSYFWPLLYKANLNKIWDPDMIEPGLVLKVIENPSYAEIKDAIYKGITRAPWKLGDGPERAWVEDWQKGQ